MTEPLPSETHREVGQDTRALRKARGAFFTPADITRFITRWAVRSAEDTVLEPSAGDAAFLVEATRRLKSLSSDEASEPRVDGVEIHGPSASTAVQRVRDAGGTPHITVSDFFDVPAAPAYSAVIGNPPYIRYQEFTGENRVRARQAALGAGVRLTALASSWAAFTVHAAGFLRPGGRLGLVLPAELLSVNYAAPVREFLFDAFASVHLVLFQDHVFPDVEADVLLLLADGYRTGSTDHAEVFQVRDASELPTLGTPMSFTPESAAGKWTGLLTGVLAQEDLSALTRTDAFTVLEEWGDTTLGMVTGNNRYFTLSPDRARELALPQTELVPISPPGSKHLRRLSLDHKDLDQLGRAGRSTLLFRPAGAPSPAAQSYIDYGHEQGVDHAYKCRVRRPWYRVPLLKPADLMLTCMNADTPRVVSNDAGVRHLNSVHGVYLRDELRALGKKLLPLAMLNSATMLSAELVGRSYGGGILKMEPREADHWLVPGPGLISTLASDLLRIRPRVVALLDRGNLADAVTEVDAVVLGSRPGYPVTNAERLRTARDGMHHRRLNRGRSGS